MKTSYIINTYIAYGITPSLRSRGPHYCQVRLERDCSSILLRSNTYRLLLTHTDLRVIWPEQVEVHRVGMEMAMYDM
jgi:hypothetical protein